MSVAFDAESESHTGTTPSTSEASYTWNHGGAASGVKGVLVYAFTNANGGNPIETAVTYGGVAMTKVGDASDTTTEPQHCSAWFLGESIPQGTQAVVVTRTNNGVQSYSVCFTVTAAADTEVTGVGVLEDNQTVSEVSVDDGSPGTDSLRFYGFKSGLGSIVVAGDNSTAGPSIDPGAQTAMTFRETTPGQGARLVGPSTPFTDDVAVVYLAIREIASSSADAAIAQTLPALTQAVTAEVLLESAIDQTLPALTQAVVTEALLEAALAQTLPSLTQAATATVGSVAEAAIAQTLPALIQALTAESTIEGSAAQTLPSLTQVATAESTVAAVIAAILPALTQSAAAESIIEVAIAQTLPSLSQDASVAVVVDAVIAQALPALIQAATAQAVETAEASIDQTLPALTQSATAFAAVEALDAAITQNLPALEQRARVVFGGGGRDGFVVWRETRNPNKTKRRLPFQGGTYR